MVRIADGYEFPDTDALGWENDDREYFKSLPEYYLWLENTYHEDGSRQRVRREKGSIRCVNGSLTFMTREPFSGTQVGIREIKDTEIGEFIARTRQYMDLTGFRKVEK